MSERRFKATIARSGSRVLLMIPFDPNDTWGEKDRHYVTGSIAGHKIRGVLVSNGAQFFLPLGPAWRRDNAIDSGAAIDVVLGPEGPRSETIASDVAAALDREPKAKTFFESLAPFYRKNFIRWIESAKRPQTRATRITEMVDTLKAGRRQR